MRWAGHVARVEESCMQGFWCGNLTDRNHLEDPGADGMIILKWILKVYMEGGIDLINVTQDRERLRAVMNTAMNLRLP